MKNGVQRPTPYLSPSGTEGRSISQPNASNTQLVGALDPEIGPELGHFVGLAFKYKKEWLDAQREFNDINNMLRDVYENM